MNKQVVHEKIGGVDAPAADQAQVSEVLMPENSASGSQGAPCLGDSAVATQQQEGAGNGAGSSPAGIDADWPHRLAAANRYLLVEISEMRQQLRVAAAGMKLLETVSHDWNEAAAAVKTWEEVTT